MNETLKELAGDLQMIHQFLEQAEATERQLERYVRELEREKAKAVADESRHWVDIIRRLDYLHGNCTGRFLQCQRCEGNGWAE